MAMAREIAEALGGRRVLKLRTASSDALRREVGSGLPYRSFEALRERLGLTREEMSAAIRVAPRTLARRKREGKLRPDESDRLLRVARIASEAARILGTGDAAASWLREPILALGWVAPISLIDTDLGARQVEEILGRIEFGVFS